MRRLAAIGAIALVVGACNQGSDPTAEPSTTSGSVTSSTTTTSPTTTSSSISATTTTAPTTTTTTLLEFPPQWEGLTHGGDAWAVILHVSEDFEDPAFAAANEAAEAAGYLTGQTDCDWGAAEAAGFSDDGHYYTMSVYFESEEVANQAKEAFQARGVESVVGLVQTLCLD